MEKAKEKWVESISFTGNSLIMFWFGNGLNDLQRKFAWEVIKRWKKFWSRTVCPCRCLFLTFKPTVTSLEDCVDMHIKWDRGKESVYHWNMIDGYMGHEIREMVLDFNVCMLLEKLENEAVELGREHPLVLAPPPPTEAENDLKRGIRL